MPQRQCWQFQGCTEWGWAAGARPRASRKSHPLYASHGLPQLSVTFPQAASSPFPSNQVLGNVLSVLEKAGKGEGTRASLRADVDWGGQWLPYVYVKFCPSVSTLTTRFPELTTHLTNSWEMLGLPWPAPEQYPLLLFGPTSSFSGPWWLDAGYQMHKHPQARPAEDCQATSCTGPTPQEARIFLVLTPKESPPELVPCSMAHACGLPAV